MNQTEHTQEARELMRRAQEELTNGGNNRIAAELLWGAFAAIQNLMKSDTPRMAQFSSDSFDASPTTAGIAGLTRSPRPDTGKLKPGQLAKLSAALASRSFNVPHPSHLHSRSESVRSSFFQPQWAHSLDDGNHRSAFTNSEPYQAHLYSSLARNPDIPASAMERASLRLRSMPDTFRVSTTTRPAHLAIAVVAL